MRIKNLFCYFTADGETKLLEGDSAKSSPKKGYDFTANTCGSFGPGETSNFSFTPPRSTPPQSIYSSCDPFVFGCGAQDVKLANEKKNSQKWLKEDGKPTKER